LLQEIGGPWATSLTLACLGSVALDQGNIASAKHLLLESLTLGWESDDRWFVGHALASLAIAAERQQQSLRAARLIGQSMRCVTGFMHGFCISRHRPRDLGARSKSYAGN
jgi:hypothetical protein